MRNDNEQMEIEFHDKASIIFFALLQNFELTVQELNRQTEEYKFQHAKDIYSQSLKRQLESCATRLMQDHQQNKTGDELSQNLQHHIAQYLHLFVQKARLV